MILRSAKPQLDAGALRDAVDALDPIVALLALVHLTGDRKLLSHYGPALEAGRNAGQLAFVSASGGAAAVADSDVVAEICEQLATRMQNHPEPLLRTPDKALFRQMVHFCLGVELDDASLEMAREQSGFATDEREIEPTSIPKADFSVLVLGAGMIGINAAIKLKAAGFNYRVIEKRDELGGTWSENTYPGVAVDTPSVQYSFSFELNASWSKYYPSGPEYQAYLKRVAEKHGITADIDFGTVMKKCVWDDARCLWIVTCVRGGIEHVYEANVVISALGFLNRPAYPAVEGIELFTGPIVHSARWDPTVDLAGKKVVLVGTGCTAAQLSTGIADVVSELVIIQRQPNWIMPNQQVLQRVKPEERFALENIPYVAQWVRFQSLALLLTSKDGIMTIDPDWRAQVGGVSAMNDAVRKVGLDYIETHFADRPDLKVKVTPDFPFFAKRPVLDCGYYNTLKKPNVELVQGSLSRCEEHAVILEDGTRVDCDVLLFATGFNLEFLSGYDIRGRDGQALQEVWTPFPYAYLGLEVPGFPNFFVTCGPNSGLSASHTTLGEQQVHYIIEALQLMVNNDLASIEATSEATTSYNHWISEQLARTVWVNSGTAHGYYRHASGKVVLAYPRTNVHYWKALREPVLSDHCVIYRDAEAKTATLRTALVG